MTIRKRVWPKGGFSLVELLVVVGIVLLLVGLLFPVAALVKKSSHRSTCLSNLHQCTTALLLYADPYDGLQSMPVYSVANRILARAPTCDAEDSFRTSCAVQTQAPLIGSYAYVRGVEGYDTQKGWTDRMTSNNAPYLLACTFYGTAKVKPFNGIDTDPCVVDSSCWMPSVLLRSLPDGSVQARSVINPSKHGSGTFPLFSWEAVFEIP